MKKLLLIVVFLLGACSQTQSFEFVQHPTTPIQIDEIEKVLHQHKGIEKANILLLEREIVVAAQVQALEKMNKQKIEKAIKKELQETYKDQKVFVSTDFKMFWETSKLLDNDAAKIQEKVEELKQLTEEET